MNDLLSFLAQSYIFLWPTVATTTTIVVVMGILRKRHSFFFTEARIKERLVLPLTVGLIFGLIIGGLIILLQPRTFSSESYSELSPPPIEALYLLDVSGSMSMSNITWGIEDWGIDCVDEKGKARIQNGGRRPDCIGAILLEKLLAKNPQSNVAVLMFAGATVTIGPTTDHETLMDTVWLNLQQNDGHRFTNATNIRGALAKALEILMKSGDENYLRSVPVIIASDLGDANQKLFLSLLTKLKEKGLNIIVFAIGAGEEDIIKTRVALGNKSVFVIEKKEDLKNVSLEFPKIFLNHQKLSENRVSEMKISSFTINVGVGMLVSSLFLSIWLIRTVRWPGGE